MYDRYCVLQQARNQDDEDRHYCGVYNELKCLERLKECE